MVSREELYLQAQELRASRARLVAAADAARRRIERDLHDGTQQQLVAVAVKLQLARQLGESDPEAAAALLDEIKEDVHEALDCVRELAEAIYPPLLLDRGLGDALAAAAAKAAAPTRAETAGLGRYAPEVETTAYFCFVEVLERIAAQADPRLEARIRAWEDDAGLRFELHLTGAAEASLPDTTLDALRDRLGAVDGELSSVVEPGGGTRLLATIPLHR